MGEAGPHGSLFFSVSLHGSLGRFMDESTIEATSRHAVSCAWHSGWHSVIICWVKKV